MRLHRRRRAGLVALLSSAAAAVLGATLVLQPAASAGVQPDSGPDLSRGEEVAAPGLTTVAFQTTGDSSGAGTDSFSGPPSVIWCTAGAFNPRVDSLTPTAIRATVRAQCTWPMPTMIVTSSLFRGDDRVATRTSTGFNKQVFDVHAFGPCQGGAYFTAGTATIFPPPGYSPPSRTFAAVSGVVAINGAGTAVPPFVCQQSSNPPPTDPPPPSGAPVINSLHCEYIGNNGFNCLLSASNWTQIRWSVNGSARPAWDNRTVVTGGCSGSTARIDVDVSNANGTARKTGFVSCVGEVN